MGSQIASLHADFQRAAQQGNVMRAEAAARQLGRLTLDNALELLFLYAEKEPIKSRVQVPLAPRPSRCDAPGLRAATFP